MYLASKSNLFSTHPNNINNIKNESGMNVNLAKFKNLATLPDKSRPAVAGLLGGSMATLLLHPLDLLKTRQAVHCNGEVGIAKESYSTVTKAIKSILKDEGGFRGLYSGVKANVVLSGTSWGIYFMSYGTIKQMIGGEDNQISTKDHLAAAFGAGVVTTLITNPLAVARTKLVMNSSKISVGIYHQLKQIVKKQGIKGMYKGLVPSILNVSHGTIQFVAYECIKDFIKQDGKKATTLETLGACSASKLFAAILTYPFQNIRACQQAAEKDFKVNITLKSIPGLYKGMVPYLMHVVPNVCMVFMIYEFVAGNTN